MSFACPRDIISYDIDLSLWHLKKNVFQNCKTVKL